MSDALSTDVDMAFLADEGEPVPVRQEKVDGLYVRFFQEKVFNELKSRGGIVNEDKDGRLVQTHVKGAGRPIYDLVDFIEIRIPGDKTQNVKCEARADHKRRFPEQWREYARNKTAAGTESSGTPLEMFVNQARAEELRFFNIRTVEQLANLSDSNLGAIGMDARALRTKAQEFLAAADKSKDGGKAALLEMNAKQEALEKQIAAQAAQIAELLANANRPPAAPEKSAKK